jgi:RNA polymerase sigma factor (sigma-70 family)
LVPTADEPRLDPAEVARLYLEYGEPLRRFVMGVLRDAQLTQDVLQVTFARMVEKGHATREESRKSWLFRVAYNEALALRRRAAVGQRVVQRLADGASHAAAAADEGLLRYEKVQAVKSALAQLPPTQRDVVRMRIYEEKTFAQISEELGIPLGTALGRMRTALQKLRNLLTDTDLPED